MYRHIIIIIFFVLFGCSTTKRAPEPKMDHLIPINHSVPSELRPEKTKGGK